MGTIIEKKGVAIKHGTCYSNRRRFRDARESFFKNARVPEEMLRGAAYLGGIVDAAFECWNQF